jgi:hypothetical protein
MEAHRLVGRRGFHIFWTIGSQMTVRLSVLCTGHSLTPEDSWYSFLLEAEWNVESRNLEILFGGLYSKVGLILIYLRRAAWVEGLANHLSLSWWRVAGPSGYVLISGQQFGKQKNMEVLYRFLLVYWLTEEHVRHNNTLVADNLRNTLVCVCPCGKFAGVEPTEPRVAMGESASWTPLSVWRGARQSSLQSPSRPPSASSPLPLLSTNLTLRRISFLFPYSCLSAICNCVHVELDGNTIWRVSGPKCCVVMYLCESCDKQVLCL